MQPRRWPWSRVSQPRENAAPTPGPPPAPQLTPIRSWGDVPDFADEEAEVAFWGSHDASRLFVVGPWWRKLWLRAWAGFWYVVGFVWGLLTGKP
jgi:hypothetical protein